MQTIILPNVKTIEFIINVISNKLTVTKTKRSVFAAFLHGTWEQRQIPRFKKLLQTNTFCTYCRFCNTGCLNMNQQLCLALHLKCIQFTTARTQCRLTHTKIHKGVNNVILCISLTNTSHITHIAYMGDTVNKNTNC